jgi:hypothetical protein
MGGYSTIGRRIKFAVVSLNDDQTVRVVVALDPEIYMRVKQEAYRRHIGIAAIIGMMIENIVDDDLFGAVLDDAEPTVRGMNRNDRD